MHLNCERCNKRFRIADGSSPVGRKCPNCGTELVPDGPREQIDSTDAAASRPSDARPAGEAPAAAPAPAAAASRRRWWRSKPAIAIGITLAIFIAIGGLYLAFAPSPYLAETMSDLTVVDVCRALEADGWQFKNDEYLSSLQTRYISYGRDAGACRVDANIECVFPGELESLMFWVHGPFDAAPHTDEGRIACQAFLNQLTPDLGGTVLDALVHVEKKGGGRGEKFDLERTEGVATTSDGWRVTAICYLEAFRGGSNQAFFLYRVDRTRLSPSVGTTESGGRHDNSQDN